MAGGRNVGSEKQRKEGTEVMECRNGWIAWLPVLLYSQPPSHCNVQQILEILRSIFRQSWKLSIQSPTTHNMYYFSGVQRITSTPNPLPCPQLEERGTFSVLGLMGPTEKSVKYTICERVCKQGDCGEGGQIWFGVSMKDGPRLCAPNLPLIRGVAIIFKQFPPPSLD